MIYALVMSVRVLIRDFPHRTIALTTGDRALVFRHSSSAEPGNRSAPLPFPSGNQQNVAPRCLVEFVPRSSIDEINYRAVSKTLGTLGLITLGEDVFLCTVTLASEVATIRPGETVQRIQGVEFRVSLERTFERADANGLQTVLIGQITTMEFRASRIHISMRALLQRTPTMAADLSRLIRLLSIHSMLSGSCSAMAISTIAATLTSQVGCRKGIYHSTAPKPLGSPLTV